MSRQHRPMPPTGLPKCADCDRLLTKAINIRRGRCAACFGLHEALRIWVDLGRLPDPPRGCGAPTPESANTTTSANHNHLHVIGIVSLNLVGDFGGALVVGVG